MAAGSWIPRAFSARFQVGCAGPQPAVSLKTMTRPPSNDFDQELKQRLHSLRAQGLFRKFRRVDSPQSTCNAIGGRILLNFSSNDYLGLDNEPALKEAAVLKLAYEFTRRTRRARKPRFLALEGVYHGDTVGAVSLGHIDLFHRAYAGLLFKTDTVRAPYCYRYPFNRARPERADARDYRQRNWECLTQLERKFEARKRAGETYAGFVFEPSMQGAAGLIPQPAGWLRRAAEIVRGHGALLIADEVMTAFGRTVSVPHGRASVPASPKISRSQGSQGHSPLRSSPAITRASNPISWPLPKA